MSSQFAPLVFSRTREVDFRFLAIPKDFSESDMEWSQKHILATLLNSVELSENPRWSSFNDTRHYVIGLSCRANLLSERNIADKFNRGLYLFVGLVTKSPAFIPMQTDIFKPLYEFVHQKWEDDTIDAQKIIRPDYDYNLESTLHQAGESEKNGECSFNNDVSKVLIYSIRRNKELWSTFSQNSKAGSLCLNVASRKDAKEGVFLNVSSTDYRDEFPSEISRIPPKPQPVPETPIPSQGSNGNYDTHNLSQDDNSCGFIEHATNAINQVMQVPLKLLDVFTTGFNHPRTRNTDRNVHERNVGSQDDSASENQATKLPLGLKFHDDEKK